MLCDPKSKWYLLPLIVVMLSGCTSTELVVDLYQVVSTEINIIMILFGDWLRGG